MAMAQPEANSHSSLARRQVVSTLLKNREDTLVVTGLGSATYDVHAAGDHNGNFYLWGAMGGAALVGLGLAQAQPAKRVMVITGDGEQLMAFGSLATIAVAKPDNLDVIVIDNQHFGETGMQAEPYRQGHRSRQDCRRLRLRPDGDPMQHGRSGKALFNPAQPGQRAAPVRDQGRC